MGREWDFPSDKNLARLRLHQERKRRFREATQDMPKVKVEPPAGKWCAVPLLLVFSGRGRISQKDIPPGWLEKNASGEDIRLVVVRDSGHWIMLEAPERFNQALAEFADHLSP